MSQRWAFFERAPAPDVNDPESDQMVRYRLVQTPWFGLFVHRINSPDARSTLHDHPWSFLSVVLRGAYTEDFGETTQRAYVDWSPREGRVIRHRERTWRAGSVHRMRAREPHTITALGRSPTWTLVLAGRRAPEPAWGYWDQQGWTPWTRHRHTAAFEAALAARRGQDPGSRRRRGDPHTTEAADQ